jgi:hypothetical protein
VYPTLNVNLTLIVMLCKEIGPHNIVMDMNNVIFLKFTM